MSETRYFMAYKGACIARCSTVEEAIQIRNRLADSGEKPNSALAAGCSRNGTDNKGIRKRKNGRCSVYITNTYVGTYDSLDEAVAARNLFLETGIKTPTVSKPSKGIQRFIGGLSDGQFRGDKRFFCELSDGLFRVWLYPNGDFKLVARNKHIGTYRTLEMTITAQKQYREAMGKSTPIDDRYIYKDSNGQFQCYLKSTYVGIYPTLEMAISARDLYRETGVKTPSVRKSVQKNGLPTGIRKYCGRLVATARATYIGTYDTVEEAQAARKLFVETGVKTPTVRKKG